MEIWAKFVYCRFKLPKNPSPFAKSRLLASYELFPCLTWSDKKGQREASNAIKLCKNIFCGAEHHLIELRIGGGSPIWLIGSVGFKHLWPGSTFLAFIIQKLI